MIKTTFNLKNVKNPKFVGAIFLVAIALFSTVYFGLNTMASSAYSIYRYDFKNAAASVPNTAAANSSATMQLVGSWTSSSSGVTFTGNTSTTQSGGAAKPSAGNTISVPTTSSIGAAVIFVPQLNCQVDSQNMSQVGPFATGVSQIKLQLSKCTNNSTYPECRIAGASTPSGTLPVRGTTVLTAGNQYRLECVKYPDSGASAQVVMRVTDIATNSTTTSNFTIPATGTISSTAYVSAGNKHPLPSISKNTDQYLGLIEILGYCQGGTAAAVEQCLTEDVATVPPEPVADTADEIKYSYGNVAGEVVVSWRGTANNISYGPTETYTSQANATASTITPVDTTGPFYEVRLTDLTPGVTYHYKIGQDGSDRTFTVAAGDTDSFTALAIGDTIASSCRSYQNELNALANAVQPQFVLHHGDIAIANECGQPAVHQYFMDIESTYANTAAYMPVWGNHEYGNPTANAPAGTPRDSLANYKGRIAVPNPQTVPNDTATKTTHPGCGQEINSSVNTCRGEDWGWFRTGRVVFISVPELWPSAIGDWKIKATALMQSAQDDPTVDYIVTYGHRPTLSSTSYSIPTGYAEAFSALGDTFAPSANNPQGKYVLNLTGHRHGMEAFNSYHGVTQIVNGGGGQGLINFGTPLAESTYRAKHLGFSSLEYSAATHQLIYKMICGPSTSGETLTCTPGSVLYTKTFEKL